MTAPSMVEPAAHAKIGFTGRLVQAMALLIQLGGIAAMLIWG